MRVHRVYFRGGQYTDQVAANGAAARLYAERLFPKLGAPVKTECMTLVVDGRRTGAVLCAPYISLKVVALCGARNDGAVNGVSKGR